MSRTLILIRHAKAADGPTDVERPLTPRGQSDAGAIGRALDDAGYRPHRVVVSPARRARETWAAAQGELPEGPREIVADDRIYDNDADLLLDIVRETPEDVETLVLVGHNPSFGELAAHLGSREARRDGFPTAATVAFDLTGSWADLAPDSVAPRWFAVPRAG